MNPKCEMCEYHSTWTEQGIEVGFVCKHHKQTEKPGLMYGRFFSHIINSPKWCPLDKEKEKMEVQE